LAVLFQPGYEKIKSLLHGKDSFAAAIVVVLAVATILIPLVFFGFQLFIEAQGLYGRMSAGGGAPVIDWLRMATHQFFPSFDINITPYVEQVLGVLIANVGPIFSGVFTIMGTLFLSFFALYYFLKDGNKLGNAIKERSPLPANHTEEILTKLHAMTASVVRGSILVSALYGILTGIGFFIFGLPSAILWGALTIVASFIPVFGVLIIVVPGIITLVIEGNFIAAIGLLAWTLVMSAFMENYLRPRLIGRQANIHPLLMLFAVLGGLSFFGPIGILLGPLALGLLLTLLEVYPLFALENLNKK
jgi:predicted PurR-regulated permease PerM